MKTFKDLDFGSHPNVLHGFNTQARMFFENGYGVSVITGGYGDEYGPYELAVIKGNEDDFGIVYDTGITDDVIGYLDENGVTENMKKVQELPDAR